MELPKKYLHDRLVLLLITVNAFLMVVTTILILLRLGGSQTAGYFVQYRENLGLNAYKVGGASGLVAFIVFALFILVFHTLISVRIYPQRRDVSIVVLAMATLLLSLALIVSNALLVLR